MPSLSDKLKALGVQLGAKNIQPQRSAQDQDHPIETVVPGQYHSTAYGDLFVVESTFSPDYSHGRVGLWPETTLQAIADWLNTPQIATMPLEQFVFLDTETSGLSGGTGTFAFLVGVARFESDTFYLAQLFMRNPAEEKALLAWLTDFIGQCQVLVTFNGKSFDAPLLNTRYTLHKAASPLPEMAHLDLLPLARRLWRDRLPSRRLTDLERDILLLNRTTEDVPGWLIPQLYFDYVRDGDARPLGGVFYHNQLDVVAMAALLNQMAQMLHAPLSEAVEYALDLVAIGKLYEAIGALDDAVVIFNEGMERNDLPEEHYWATQHRLSFLEKRRENWPAAVEVWKLAAESKQLYAYVELAKFYEHKQRDYHTALTWTTRALDLLEQRQWPRSERGKWLADLKHRQARLRKKLSAYP
jgi:uncharacterized protein YprB with RNaseH-like and TPR domain